jgi:hypothetical protein
VPAVTFTIANAAAAHQVSLEKDNAFPPTNTVIAMIDGVEYHLDDCRARADGKALHGGGITIMVAQTTLTLIHTGHVTFSGTITYGDSNKIIAFVLACRLPLL